MTQRIHHRQSPRSQTAVSACRRGISLLEVVLAISLVGIAISLLSQLVMIGNRAAMAARDSAKAQLICESVVSEVLSGSLPLASSGAAEYPSDPDWTYQIDVAIPESNVTAALTTTNMHVITVTVAQNSESIRAVKYTMSRWMMELIPDDTAEDTTSTETGGV